MPNTIDTATPFNHRPITASGDTCRRRRTLIRSGSSKFGAPVLDSRTGTTAIETSTEATTNSAMLFSAPVEIIIWPMPSPPMVMIM